MKTKLAVVLTLSSFALALVAKAQTTGYVNDPANNSGDFAAAVGPITTYTFDTLSTGLLNPNAYAGLTFGGNYNNVVYTAGPADGNTFSGPTNTGEGLHPVSNVLETPGYVYDQDTSFTVSFATPVEAAGLFVIDNYNIEGTTTLIEAFDSSNNLLGAYYGPNDNFQDNYQYFMGISSSTANISEIEFIHHDTTGDQVALDNLEVSGSGGNNVPDGASTVTLLGSAMFGFAALRRRFFR